MDPKSAIMDALLARFKREKLAPLTINVYLGVARRCLACNDILEPLRAARVPSRFDNIAKVLYYFGPEVRAAVKAIPRPKAHPKLPKTFTTDEFIGAIEAVKQFCPPGQSHVLLVMMQSGLRIGDVFKLGRSEATAGLQAETIIQQKGGRERRWRPPELIRPVLRELLAIPAWKTLQDFFGKSYRSAYDRARYVAKKAYSKAGVREIHPHAFRHQFAILAYESDVPLTMIMKMLGHTSLATTMRYINDASSEKVEDAQNRVARMISGQT